MPRPPEGMTAAEMIDMASPLGFQLTDELPASSRPGDFIGVFRGLQQKSEELASIDPFKEGEPARTRYHEVGEEEGRVRITASVDPILRELRPKHPNGRVIGQVHQVTIERPFVTSSNHPDDPYKLFISLVTMRAGRIGEQSAFVTSKSGRRDLLSGEYTTEADRWIFVGGETPSDQFANLIDDPEALEYHQKRLWVGAQILRRFQPGLFTEGIDPVMVAPVNFKDAP